MRVQIWEAISQVHELRIEPCYPSSHDVRQQLQCCDGDLTSPQLIGQMLRRTTILTYGSKSETQPARGRRWTTRTDGAKYHLANSMPVKTRSTLIPVRTKLSFIPSDYELKTILNSPKSRCQRKKRRAGTSVFRSFFAFKAE
jgi:hypothetical protein